MKGILKDSVINGGEPRYQLKRSKIIGQQLIDGIVLIIPSEKEELNYKFENLQDHFDYKNSHANFKEGSKFRLKVRLDSSADTSKSTPTTATAAAIAAYVDAVDAAIDVANNDIPFDIDDDTTHNNINGEKEKNDGLVPAHRFNQSADDDNDAEKKINNTINNNTNNNYAAAAAADDDADEKKAEEEDKKKDIDDDDDDDDEDDDVIVNLEADFEADLEADLKTDLESLFDDQENHQNSMQKNILAFVSGLFDINLAPKVTNSEDSIVDFSPELESFSLINKYAAKVQYDNYNTIIHDYMNISSTNVCWSKYRTEAILKNCHKSNHYGFKQYLAQTTTTSNSKMDEIDEYKMDYLKILLNHKPNTKRDNNADPVKFHDIVYSEFENAEMLERTLCHCHKDMSDEDFKLSFCSENIDAETLTKAYLWLQRIEFYDEQQNNISEYTIKSLIDILMDFYPKYNPIGLYKTLVRLDEWIDIIRCKNLNDITETLECTDERIHFIYNYFYKIK